MRKIVSILVVVALLVGMFPLYADDMTIESVIQNPVTDGSQSSAAWFIIFDRLLDDKLNNGKLFFECLTELRAVDPADSVDVLFKQVQTAYTNSGNQARLTQFDLDPDAIYKIMQYYISTFPKGIDEVICDVCPDNIYTDIFYDEDLLYSDYMQRFQDYLNILFSKQPDKMKAVISKYDRLNAGEIIVMQGLMNIVIRDYICHETYDAQNLSITNREFYLRDSVLRPQLIAELTRVAGTYRDTYTGDKSIDAVEIAEYVDAFLAMGNVMLRAVEENMDTSQKIEDAFYLGNLAFLKRRIPTNIPNPVTVTLSLNTEYILLDASDPLTEGFIDEFTLIATVTGTNNPVIFTIANPAGEIVATLTNPTSRDVLVALGDQLEGLATITATVQGYNVTKECLVEIVEQTPAGAIKFFGPYISGYPDGTFKEKNNITRAEIATMFTRVLRLDLDQETFIPFTKDKYPTASFDDVDNDHWAYLYVELAKENGLLSGYNGVFKPDDPISRAEIAVVIANAWELLGIPASPLANHYIKDVSSDHWAYDAIHKVYNANIVEGFDDGTYRPENNTLRGEIVVMINGIIARPLIEPDLNTFSDIIKSHWAFGQVEAATRIQEIKNELDEEE